MLRSPWLAWAAAAVSVAAATIALVTLSSTDDDGSDTRSFRTATPKTARAFADSIGVNVHLTYTGTPYSDFARVLGSLQALGVRHVRDGLIPGRPDQYARLNKLAAAGIRSTLIMGVPGRTRASELVRILKSEVPDAVDAVEGPNEHDVSGVRAWRSELRGYQRELYAAVRRDRSLSDVAVYGPSVAMIGNQAVSRDLSGAQDATNVHSYPAGGPPEPALGRAVTTATRASGEAGVIATETGYHNGLRAHGGTQQPAVDEATAADYLPRVFLSAFADGIGRTFWYELVNTFPDTRLRRADAHFGLLRYDFTPKPAFAALRNLMRLVDDGRRGRIARRPLDVSIAEPPRNVRRLLLQQSDGVYLLALWREVRLTPDSRRALDDRPLETWIDLPRQATDVALYRPSRSPRATKRFSDIARIPVSVAGDAVIVRMKFGSA